MTYCDSHLMYVCSIELTGLYQLYCIYQGYMIAICTEAMQGGPELVYTSGHHAQVLFIVLNV